MRKCKVCKKELLGRKDKVFCSSDCKNYYHVGLRRATKKTVEKYDAILQDIQFHPVSDNILHVDFYQLFENKEVTMDIPVQFVGNSKGVRNGGVLRKNRRKLRIKALPGDLPDFIE
ncbi:MAG: 50S ribosomal protein L25, partial [Putridiphycobacter sp.]|nr:50S ribosomal protein L25 [Putridiphycobacter sp.]